MRAMGSAAAGNLKSLGLVEIDVPAVGTDQLLVRVSAAAVNPADLKVHRGEFAGRVLHARTKPIVTGFDFSGVVEACGDGVADLKSGDEVFGFLPYASKTRQGAFSERIVVARSSIARKPPTISHETAAASATPGVSAYQALRDKGRLAAGGRVLILGAAGGVGSIAVGVAKALGATVVAVCSAYATDFVRELGAEEVIDRRATDPRTIAGPFHVIFDVAAAYSYASMRHQLADAGAFVTTLPSAAWVGGKLLALMSRKRCEWFVAKPARDDLETLATALTGGLRVPIDSTFPIRELAKAFDHQAGGEVRGRIAITVDGGW